jgi:hypothetical protein
VIDHTSQFSSHDLERFSFIIAERLNVNVIVITIFLFDNQSVNVHHSSSWGSASEWDFVVSVLYEFIQRIFQKSLSTAVVHVSDILSFVNIVKSLVSWNCEFSWDWWSINHFNYGNSIGRAEIGISINWWGNRSVISRSSWNRFSNESWW